MTAAEMMQERTNISVTYVKFEDLEALAENVDKLQLLEKIKFDFESKDWKENIQAIDLLRAINKYYPADMNEVCRIYWKNIIDSLNSLRSAVAKNALIFAGELFVQTKGIKLNDQIIADVVPLLLLKCYNDKVFLKSEAQKAIDSLVTNCVYDSTLVAFCQECFSKFPQICEISTKILARLLGFIGADLPKLQPNTFRQLFITLAKVRSADADNGR